MVVLKAEMRDGNLVEMWVDEMGGYLAATKDSKRVVWTVE